MLVASVSFVLLLATACSQGPNRGASDGRPTRTIQVTMRDDFSFEPKAIKIRGGESIKFEVVNQGSGPHEFLLGNEQRQQEFEQGMQNGSHNMPGMGGMGPSGAPGVQLKGGESGSFVFVAPKSGPLLFGCHQPGHYKSGMRGILTISSALR